MSAKIDMEMLTEFSGTEQRFERADWPAAFALLKRVAALARLGDGMGWRCLVKESRRHSSGNRRDLVQVREKIPTQRRVLLRVRPGGEANSSLWFDVFLIWSGHAHHADHVIRQIAAACDAVTAVGEPPEAPPAAPPPSAVERLEKGRATFERVLALTRDVEAAQDLVRTSAATLAEVSARIGEPKAGRDELAARVDSLREDVAELNRTQDELRKRLDATARELAAKSAMLDVVRTDLAAAEVGYRPLLAEFDSAEQNLREAEANERERRAALARLPNVDALLAALGGV